MKKFDYASELNKVVKIEIKPTKIITDFNNLDSNIVVICEKLRNDGFLKEAIDLQQTYVQYKRAERELDGDKLLDLAHPKPTKIKDLNVEVKSIQDLKKDIMKLVGIKTAGADKTPKILNDAHPKPTKVLDTEVLSVQDCKEKIMKLIKIADTATFTPQGYMNIGLKNIDAHGKFYNQVFMKMNVIPLLNARINILSQYLESAGAIKKEQAYAKGIIDWINGSSYPYYKFPEAVIGCYRFSFHEYSDERNNEKEIKSKIIIANTLAGSYVPDCIEKFVITSNPVVGSMIFHTVKDGKHSFVDISGTENAEITKTYNTTPTESSAKTPNTSSTPSTPLSSDSAKHIYSSIGEYDLGRMPDSIKNNVKEGKDANGNIFLYYSKPDDARGRMTWYPNGVYYDFLSLDATPSLKKEDVDKNSVSGLSEGYDNIQNVKYVWKWTDEKNKKFDVYFNGVYIGNFDKNKDSPTKFYNPINWYKSTPEYIVKSLNLKHGYKPGGGGDYYYKPNDNDKSKYDAYDMNARFIGTFSSSEKDPMSKGLNERL